MDESETKSNEVFNSTDEDDEQKTKEKLNQRREARRRKILDNAKNRLERLNGRTTTATSPTTISSMYNEQQNVKYDNYNGSTNYTAHDTNGEFSDPEIEPDIIRQNNTNDIDTNMEFLNLFGNPSAPPPKKRHILFRARVHIVLSALISCILSLLWKSNGYSIFIAPGLCVITDLLFFRDPKPLHPTLQLAFMMFDNRLTVVVHKYIHLFGIVQSVICDLGVFLFSFCTFLYLFVLCTSNRLYNDLIVLQ